MSSLIWAVERYLGNFSEWPAEILELLFVQYPPPRMMRKLLAFFYGNGAPCSLVSQLFHACNKHSTVEDPNTIYSTYAEWGTDPMARHISRYCSLQIRKYVYLNGRQRNQRALVPYMTDPPPLGIHNTDFQFLIGNQIARIHHTNVFYLWEAKVAILFNKCHKQCYISLVLTFDHSCPSSFFFMTSFHITYILIFRIMSSIQAIERRLGSIDEWPSYIIQYLFCDAPTSAKLKILVAFFYGNGIPCPSVSTVPHLQCSNRWQCNNIFTECMTLGKN
jgi:hypothetical protein